MRGAFLPLAFSLLLAPTARAQSLEDPFAGGFCAHVPDQPCRALRLDDAHIDLAALFPNAEIALLNDFHGVLGSGERRLAGDALDTPLPVVHDFAYAGLGVLLRRPDAAADGLAWEPHDGRFEVELRIELYRGERAPIEALLSAIPVPSIALAEGCTGEQARTGALMPVYLRWVDFAGDAQPELVTGYGATFTGACSFTAVRAADEIHTVLGLVGRLPPTVSIVDLSRPDGTTQPVLQLLHECCDLEQTLVLGTIGAAGWQWLYRGDYAYALWQVSPAGQRVLAATDDLARYGYGTPDTIEGFTLLAYDGTAMAPVGTASVLGQPEPPGPIREAYLRLRAADEALYAVWPPTPRFLIGLADLPQWRAYRDAALRLTLQVMFFESPGRAERAARLAGPEYLAVRRGALLLLVSGPGADLAERAAFLVAAFTGEGS